MSLVASVESLYEGVTTRPGDWGPTAFDDWASEAAHAGLDKVEAKLVRRAMREAQRLREFWTSDARVHDDELDWRSRVDIARGPRAWRPLLELALLELEAAPTFDAFERVRSLFPVVNNAPFADGRDFDTWLDQAHSSE